MRLNRRLHPIVKLIVAVNHVQQPPIGRLAVFAILPSCQISTTATLRVPQPRLVIHQAFLAVDHVA